MKFFAVGRQEGMKFEKDIKLKGKDKELVEKTIITT